MKNRRTRKVLYLKYLSVYLNDVTKLFKKMKILIYE